MNNRTLVIFLFYVVCNACRQGSPQPHVATAISEAQAEAQKDSLEYVTALALQNAIAAYVTADVETGAVLSPQADDDAADDMAIWVNTQNPEASLLIGTNKKGGVVVFDLQGVEKAFYPTGRINNIDVMYGFPLGKEKIDLVGCTNRSDQSIDLFQIDPSGGTLTDIAANALKVDTHSLKDVYGFCFYHSNRSQRNYLFVSGKNGMVQQFELLAQADRKIGLKFIRQILIESQTEGLVADEGAGVLYIGEEDRGIWKTSAEPDGGDARTLLRMSGSDNPSIVYDVEGLTLYKKGNEGYLLASSQGNFSYAVFERGGDNPYLGSFKIADAADIDGVEETDGIDVVSVPLGTRFPKGLFAAQDGFNYKNGQLQRQNFKLISWEKIDRLIENWKATNPARDK